MTTSLYNYDWSYPSSASSESSDSVVDASLDFWIDSSSPHDSPALLATLFGAHDIDIDIDTAATMLPSYSSLRESISSSSSSSSMTSDRGSISTDSLTIQPQPGPGPIPGLEVFSSTTRGGTLMDPEAIRADRRIRRREQNRKAQTNFRQKRKEEVRRLETEVEELRLQVAAGLHQSHSSQQPGKAQVAGLTICTRCRNFYPASLQTELPQGLEGYARSAAERDPWKG